MDLLDVRKQLNMGISLSNIKLRVTYYSRVSTDHLEQKKSLKNQIEYFEQYINSNLNWTYVNGYVDDGISGTSDIKRDNFMKMIEDARLGKFDLIVTKEISRFSRNTLDSIKYTRDLLSHGVAVLFLNDNINTALPDSELRLTIMASMAQDEIRRLSERVKFGMNKAIERGEILGNDLLFGYKKDKETGLLKIVEEEAEVVRQIYELYVIEKLSLSRIVKKLNNEQLTFSHNKKWCVSTISRMIENPKYKGFYCGRKTEIVDYITKKVKYVEKDNWIVYEDKNRIPPIINDDLWEKANDRLSSRKKLFFERDNKIIYQNRYLYSAKLYCGIHNMIFHRRKFRKNNKDISWVCSEYLRNGKKICDSPNVRESELNIILEDIISNLNISLNDIVELLIKYYSCQEIDDSVDDEIIKIEKEIKKACIRKDKILELNVQGYLSNHEFYNKNNELNDKINNLNKKINQLKTGNNYENLVNKIKKILNNKKYFEIFFSKIINLLLDKIVVSKINNDKNNLELNIFLTYRKVEKKLFLKNRYEFKRGYDISCTKRYIVNYQVNTYYCI